MELNKIIIKKFETNELHETFFTTANGYLGERGTHEDHENITEALYINGFYESEEITYGENAYGYAKNNQKMLVLPSGKTIKILVNNEKITKFEDYEKSLDFSDGVVCKKYQNDDIFYEFKTFASQKYQEVMVYKYVISAKKDIDLYVESCFDFPLEKENEFDPRVHRVNSKDVMDCIVFENKYVYTTKKSLKKVEIEVIENSTHNLNEKFKLRKGEVFEFEKFVIYKDEYSNFNEVLNFNTLFSFQKEYFASFFKTSGIVIPEYSKAINYNLFSLISSVGKDEHRNISAKGLTGEGYGGHYFWDTEIYVIPFFIYTNKKIARNLLKYRYNILQASIDRAAELSFKGALYAWRTIDGTEASAYYPAGTAQIHINADIAYAIQMYYEATLDVDFIQKYGYEMLYEMALFYVDYSDYIENKGYCFNGVTGPDEYTAIVNNNAYTNLMIQNHFLFLLKIVEEFNFEVDEIIEKIKGMVEHIYIPRQGLLIKQDDSFLEKSPWDKTKTLRPLLLHYHPLVIYKHQVSKQADTLLAMYLLRGNFSNEEFLCNYDFYEKLNTHDSSLSMCIHGMVASLIKKDEISRSFFEKTLNIDLNDLHHNTKDGVHIANMGGVWQYVVFGLCGVRFLENKIMIEPNIFEGIEMIEININYRNEFFNFKVRNNDLEINSTNKKIEIEFIKRKLEL